MTELEKAALREVNRPIWWMAGSLLIVAIIAIVLAFALSGCINLGPQRVAFNAPVSEIPKGYQ